MLQAPLESCLTLQGADKSHFRTARPNLALPDRLQLAEATKAGRLEVAMAAAADMVEAVVATEALLHPAADARFSSTMFVILPPILDHPVWISVDTIDIVAVHRWLARLEGLVSSSWYVPSPRTNVALFHAQGCN